MPHHLQILMQTRRTIYPVSPAAPKSVLKQPQPSSRLSKRIDHVSASIESPILGPSRFLRNRVHRELLQSMLIVVRELRDEGLPTYDDRNGHGCGDRSKPKSDMV
ncbi:hypothetical protein V7S43_012759 [Phytophthora oleae]|uniref:Uncharacterized protein n=1 Tax=Phytophthora oleae TaxID=2107226 RepID=A0ABD3F6E1_9STRA